MEWYYNLKEPTEKLSGKYKYILLDDEVWNSIARCPMCASGLDFSKIGIPGAQCKKCGFFFYTIADKAEIEKRKKARIYGYMSAQDVRCSTATAKRIRPKMTEQQMPYEKEQKKCTRPSCKNPEWNDTGYCWECYREQKQV